MGWVWRLLLAALCSPGRTGEEVGWGKVTREATNLGGMAGLSAGSGSAPGEVRQQVVGTHAKPVSLQPLHSPGPGAPGAGDCRLRLLGALGAWHQLRTTSPSSSQELSYPQLSLGQSARWGKCWGCPAGSSASPLLGARVWFWGPPHPCQPSLTTQSVPQ